MVRSRSCPKQQTRTRRALEYWHLASIMSNYGTHSGHNGTQRFAIGKLLCMVQMLGSRTVSPKQW